MTVTYSSCYLQGSPALVLFNGRAHVSLLLEPSGLEDLRILELLEYLEPDQRIFYILLKQYPRAHRWGLESYRFVKKRLQASLEPTSTLAVLRIHPSGNYCPIKRFVHGKPRNSLGAADVLHEKHLALHAGGWTTCC